MQLLSAGATLAFVAVSAVVGLRLLSLARRTHAVPELALGLAFFLVGALGYPLGLAAVLPGTSETATRACFGVSQLATGVGSAAVFVFTRATFRPDAAWALWIVRLAALVLAAQTAFSVERAFNGDPAQFSAPGLDFTVRQAATAFSYAWTGLEALRYRALLVRRLALGLAEAEVVNRFLLWAVAGAGAFLGSSTMSAVSLTGAAPWSDPVALSAVGAGGLVAAVCTALAFMPPRAYLAWVRGADSRA
jgi:hypothetical protein